MRCLSSPHNGYWPEMKRTFFTVVIVFLMTSFRNQIGFSMVQLEAKRILAFVGWGTDICKLCRERRVLVPTIQSCVFCSSFRGENKSAEQWSQHETNKHETVSRGSLYTKVYDTKSGKSSLTSLLLSRPAHKWKTCCCAESWLCPIWSS